MPDANSGKSRSRPGLLGRLWNWIDQRTGADRILRHSLGEQIPGGARFAYVFGSALFFIFLSQIVTGVSLALYYVPSPMAAHVSVAYIIKEVAAGSFLHSLHSYGSSAMVVVLVLHFLPGVSLRVLQRETRAPVDFWLHSFAPCLGDDFHRLPLAVGPERVFCRLRRHRYPWPGADHW